MSRRKSLALRQVGRARQIANEQKISSKVPITHFVDLDIVGTRDGDLMSTIHLQGAPYETADMIDLNDRFRKRSNLFLSLFTEGASVYHHFVRRQERFYPEGDFESDFALQLDAAWENRLSDRQYRNDHYLTIMIRPEHSHAVRGVFGASKKTYSAKARAEAIAKLRELVDIVLTGFSEYKPRLVEADIEGGESEFLSLMEFLLTGQWRRIAPPRMNLGDAVGANRLYFARNVVAMTDPVGAERHAAILGFKEYPAETFSTLMAPLYAIPAEFVVTQSFTPMVRDKAISAINLQQRRMRTAEDAAVSLREQLSAALDDLVSGRVAFGTHHVTVTVYAPGPGTEPLQRSLSLLRGRMTNSGLSVVREDLNLEPAFWAMLPGNQVYGGGRNATISSANFAGLVSLTSSEQGEKESIWGPAITVFETSASTPFSFNFHLEDVGNMVLFGPTGAGKTALLSFLIAQAERVRPRVIVMDKDHGAEILVRALGGKYAALNPGVDAKLNPFLIERENEAEARSFLADWVTSLLFAGDETPPPDATQAIRLAVDEIRDAPAEARHLGMLSQVLGGGEQGADLLDRLQPWIEGGDRSWAFNSREDLFSQLFDARIAAVDLTKILDDKRAAAPWMGYLFGQIETALAEGQPTLIVLDEAWRMLADETFAGRIQNWMKTIRKLNGAVIFATQEPEDAVNTPVGRTVIQQSPTQILLPNPRADEETYRTGLRLTQHEVALVREIGAAGRYLMIRRNNRSVLARFDLAGMKPFIDVLSARAETIAEMGDLREAHGEAGWLKAFMERRMATPIDA